MNYNKNPINKDSSLASSKADDNRKHDEQHDLDSSTEGSKPESAALDPSRPQLGHDDSNMAGTHQWWDHR